MTQSGTVTLRPSRTAALLLAAFLVACAVALVLFLTARIPDLAGPRAAAAVVALPCLFAAYILLSAFRHVLRVDPDAVTARGLVFTRSASRAAIAGAALVTHHDEQGDRHTLHLLDREGYSVLQIDSGVWNRTHYRRVVAALSLPAGTFRELAARDFTQRRR